MERSAAELLDAWQEAVRAAELAERLATLAAEQTKEATERALLSAELAELVEQAAEAAVLASERAIAAATQATALAERLRGEGMDAAWRTVERRLPPRAMPVPPIKGPRPNGALTSPSPELTNWVSQRRGRPATFRCRSGMTGWALRRASLADAVVRSTYKSRRRWTALRAARSEAEPRGDADAMRSASRHAANT